MRPQRRALLCLTFGALHRDGKMTDAEFEKAKQIILVAAAKASRQPSRDAGADRSSKGVDGPAC